MPPPGPSNPPQPPRRSSLPFLLLALIVGVGILAYTQGWLSFNKDKFKEDQTAVMNKGKEWISKLTKAKPTSASTKPEDVAAQKQHDEAVKEIEAITKEAEATTEEKKIQELQDRLNKAIQKANAPKKD